MNVFTVITTKKFLMLVGCNTVDAVFHAKIMLLLVCSHACLDIVSYFHSSSFSFISLASLENNSNLRTVQLACCPITAIDREVFFLVFSIKFQLVYSFSALSLLAG